MKANKATVVFSLENDLVIVLVVAYKDKLFSFQSFLSCLLFLKSHESYKKYM